MIPLNSKSTGGLLVVFCLSQPDNSHQHPILSLYVKR